MSQTDPTLEKATSSQTDELPNDREIFTLVEQYTPELVALPESGLIRCRVSRERVLELSQTTNQSLKDHHLPTLADELSAKRTEERRIDYKRIHDLRYVFYGTDLRFEDPYTSEQKSRRKELAPLVRQYDDDLFDYLWAVFKRNDKIRPILDAIKIGRGLLDDCDDVLREVELARTNWPALDGKFPLVRTDLDLMARHSTELLGLLTRQDEDTEGSPANLRKRAFTLWFRAYHEIFHLGRYLSRNDAQVNTLFPGVFPQRSEPSKTPTPLPDPVSPPNPS